MLSRQNSVSCQRPSAGNSRRGTSGMANATMREASPEFGDLPLPLAFVIPPGSASDARDLSDAEV